MSEDCLYIYFLLAPPEEISEDEDDELVEECSIEELTYRFDIPVDIHSEGHCEDGLLCYFQVRKRDIPSIQKTIEERHGGGDDIIFLSTGFEARDFEIVEHPGLYKGIPFDNWDEYLEKNNEL